MRTQLITEHMLRTTDDKLNSRRPDAIDLSQKVQGESISGHLPITQALLAAC